MVIERLTRSSIAGATESGSPGWGGLVAPQAVPGQPGQARHHPVDGTGQEPAPADAVPARPARRLPRQDRPRPHAPSVTSTIEDRLVRSPRTLGAPCRPASPSWIIHLS